MNILKIVALLCWLGIVAGTQPAAFEAAAARLLERVRLPRARLRDVPFVREDLERTLRLHWPGTDVTPFGAILAGLGVVDSDLDCFAKLPEPYHERTVYQVQEVLEKYPHLFHRPAVPRKARMPHVRFVHVPTGLQCDVSFRHQAGVRNTALISYLMRLDKRVLDFTTLVKYWAKLHKPPWTRRIMANYAMVSLAVFYLQQVNVLPSIAMLQKNADEIIIERWNAGFNEIPYRSSNNASLFELLGGFFQYYERFDFEGTIVSIFTGAPIRRSVFQDVVTVPDTFALYKRNVADNANKDLDISTPVCIQDVFFHCINIASDCSPEVFAKFKSDLRLAAKTFAESKDDILETLFGRNEDFVVQKQPTQVNYWPNSTNHCDWKSCWKRTC